MILLKKSFKISFTFKHVKSCKTCIKFTYKILIYTKIVDAKVHLLKHENKKLYQTNICSIV